MRRPRWTFAHATLWSALFIACSDDPAEERPAEPIEITVDDAERVGDGEPPRPTVAGDRRSTSRLRLTSR